MSEGPGICVVGSLNMDLVVRTPRLPAAGETLIGGPFGTFHGGKGANQAVAAARLGGSVTMVGAVGDDEFGGLLRAGLEGERIEARLAVRAGVATGVALITVDAAGENTIVVAPGANASVDAELLVRHEDALTTAQLLICQLEVPVETVQRAAEIARSYGARVVLNAAPARTLPAALLDAVDVLVVNRVEAAALADAAPDTDVETLAGALRDLGPELVVITLGAEGAVASEASVLHRQPAFAVEPIDSVGAGDAFVGALAIELAADQAVHDALRTACAAGALTTTRHGAQPSLPSREELTTFLASPR